MRVHLSMRFPRSVATALDRARRRGTRTRTGQVLHYVRLGLADEGLLPDLDLGIPESLEGSSSAPRAGRPDGQ